MMTHFQLTTEAPKDQVSKKTFLKKIYILCVNLRSRFTNLCMALLTVHANEQNAPTVLSGTVGIVHNQGWVRVPTL